MAGRLAKLLHTPMMDKHTKKRIPWPWYAIKYDIAEIMVAKLTQYKEGYMENGLSFPEWLLDDSQKKSAYTDEEIASVEQLWHVELDKMILAFRQVQNYMMGFNEAIGYDEEVIQEGLDSFAKYFLHLWD